MPKEKRYSLSKQGVFSTVQGEGLLMGLPMVFIRLAGCSVVCPECDTDYSFNERVSVDEIAERAADLATPGTEWAWVTGGEPTDHDLAPLCSAIRERTGLRLALATSGIRPVQRGLLHNGWDFVSVSPHDPKKWVLRRGNQLNLVPGLNGFGLADFSEIAWACRAGFDALYVTPCEGKPESMGECLEWVKRYPGWRLGVQAQRQWGIP